MNKKIKDRLGMLEGILQELLENIDTDNFGDTFSKVYLSQDSYPELEILLSEIKKLNN